MRSYIVTRQSFIGAELKQQGDIVDYAGPPGANLEPVEAATRRIAGEPAQSAASLLDDEPAVENDLDGTKASLIEIAEREGVGIETDDNKADIRAKIEAHRQIA